MARLASADVVFAVLVRFVQVAFEQQIVLEDGVGQDGVPGRPFGEAAVDHVDEDVFVDQLLHFLQIFSVVLQFHVQLVDTFERS